MITKQAKSIWISALLVLAATGCGSSTGSGVKIGNSIWSTSETEFIPGIDAGAVSDVTLKSGDGLRFVIWTDMTNWTGTGGGSPPSYHGQFVATDGRKLTVHAETNGKSATVTIAGKQYDSASGALFLISTHDETPTVEQIDLNSIKLPSYSDEFPKFARQHEILSKFFGQPHKQTDAEK
jgi:hypothetical protein